MADDDETPADAEPDPALAKAVDDALKREVWAQLAPRFQELTFESRRLQPPRHRTDVDDILDSIRNQDPNEERPD
ncbi:hypothetical protein GCM10023200_42470 [Actinomycetospora chlora]|uniref:Uncharacterized protein n=1 Tax=Actinomycetospora chlora TaxID=663608 RepID=A0ABP9BXQ8_9PSEU